MLTKDQVKDLCVPSMYWEMHMRDALEELLRTNSYVGGAFSSYFGPTVVQAVNRKESSLTFSEFYAVCSPVVDIIVSFDSSELQADRALFHALEDVLFYLGESVTTYEKVTALVTALGIEDVEAVVNEIGCDVAGYPCAQ